MDRALRDATRRTLRPAGYKGACPNLRRTSAAGLDLISFDHSKHGGLFLVLVGSVSPDRAEELVASTRRPLDKITASYLRGSEQIALRCPPPTDPEVSPWFYYGLPTYLLRDDVAEGDDYYAAIATRAMNALADQQPALLQS